MTVEGQTSVTSAGVSAAVVSNAQGAQGAQVDSVNEVTDSGTGATHSGGQATSGGEATGVTAGSPWASLDAERQGYIKNKGFKDAGALLDSYRNLEKLIGVPHERVVKLPDNTSDHVKMAEVYQKLGRPDSAEGYGLKPIEGDSSGFVDALASMFHEAGLTKSQANHVVSKWNDYFKATDEKFKSDASQKLSAEVDALKKEWGAAYDQNTKIVDQAGLQFGITQEQMQALRGVLGVKGIMEFLYNVGTKLGEGDFKSGTTIGSVLTPDQARAKISELNADPEFSNKYINGDKWAKEEMEKYFKMAYPSN